MLSRDARMRESLPADERDTSFKMFCARMKHGRPSTVQRAMPLINRDLGIVRYCACRKRGAVLSHQPLPCRWDWMEKLPCANLLRSPSIAHRSNWVIRCGNVVSLSPRTLLPYKGALGPRSIPRSGSCSCNLTCHTLPFSMQMRRESALERCLVLDMHTAKHPQPPRRARSP